MKTKNTIITLGGLCLLALAAFILSPADSKAGRNNYKIEPNISIEPYKSDVIKITESYERIFANHIGTMQNQLAETDRGLEKVSTKLDKIEKKIDDLGKRLTKIEKALNITEEIPKPK
jgi:septal ring factor EnvC (AmiA/AmiB activator)